MTNITTCTSVNECHETEKRTGNTLSALAGSAYEKVKAYFAMRRKRRIDRDAFNQLMTLDEKNLKDIGITRDDVRHVSSLSLHENASRELEKIRAQNIATARWKAMQIRRRELSNRKVS